MCKRDSGTCAQKYFASNPSNICTDRFKDVLSL